MSNTQESLKLSGKARYNLNARFIKAHRKAFFELPAARQQEEANIIWKRVKKDVAEVERLIAEWTVKANARKAKESIAAFFAKSKTSSDNTSLHQPSSSSEFPTPAQQSSTLSQNVLESELSGDELPKLTITKKLVDFRRKTTRDCVPVKIVRPQNDLMKEHIDGHFASAAIKHLRDLASMMGQECVFFMSQDDKARIPLGISAANKQSRIVMHMQYRVKLPDHDWVIAERHKLIPSVYAACEFTKDGEVGYSGPTFVCIRSGKHDKSESRTHLRDLKECLKLQSFEKSAMTSEGNVKPIWIFSVDGGPDENPRFKKTLMAYFQIFKENDVDLLVVATHAPGQSAFNPVERRMAPLSHDLAGLILPYNTFGSHLDKNGKTVDLDREKKNFEAAGQALAEVWSSLIIGDHPVLATWVSPDEEKPLLELPKQKWIVDHVSFGQYLLQFRKCLNKICCRPYKTNIRKILKDGFLPGPIPFSLSSKGPKINANGRFLNLATRLAFSKLQPENMIFDQFCPSIANSIQDRTCSNCAFYFSSKSLLSDHNKAKICVKSNNEPEILDDVIVLLDRINIELHEIVDENANVLGLSDGLPILQSDDPYRIQFEDLDSGI
uniref:C2H2-type domain-containing protein n=1 Tax=Acrobeloides nanus TaxID=290746 RepID=A0A914DJC8_9BILA